MTSTNDDAVAVRTALKSGELLAACDCAEKGHEADPQNPELRYLWVLALARAGATQQATRRYAELGLPQLLDLDLPPSLKVDIATLGARLVKDRAFAASGDQRHALLREAADRYRSVYENTGDFFPGINAATLSLLAGDAAAAADLARAVLRVCADHAAEHGAADYYLHATVAEAALLLEDAEYAAHALADAFAVYANDYGALATTRRQLRLVCSAKGIAPEILDTLRVPGVIHFTGHMIGRRMPPAAEPVVREQIRAHLERADTGFGYGSLASGADILFAEALIDRGAELHVVLPFNEEEFKRISVAAAGDEWLPRFDRCLKAATHVSFTTTDQYLGDDRLFAYASELAMGLALLRAEFLQTSVQQLAVWDGQPPVADAGAAVDVAIWRRKGLSTDIIAPSLERTGERSDEHDAKGASVPARSRVMAAMLFGDVKWFSKLRDAQIPIFVREVLGRFAAVLEKHADSVLHRNTWGDGLYVVTPDAESAAACALHLQEAMRTLDPVAHGLPPYMALRLGGHVGPVFELQDPVLRTKAFMGSHVIRTARIEPATPEGEVYVTESFAAALALSPECKFSCEYVGTVVLPKGFGTIPMYSLKLRAPTHAD